tara:strand:- start:293 stop:937 length:645 start_codon:yes stop_codon:yes gene_type:complete
MALPTSFKERIKDLAGVAYLNNDATNADDSAIQQFLTDGCYDVIFRVGAVSPDVLGRFTEVQSSSSFSQGTVWDENREVIGVYRNNKRCNAGKARYHDSYGDSASIHYAHTENPVWYIFNGGIYVMPSSASLDVSIYYIPDYDIDIDTLVITNFPKSYHEHICLYAAVRVLDYRIQEVIEEDEDGEMMALLRAQQQKLQADYEAKFAIQSGGRR